jgi:hypothetical protein
MFETQSCGQPKKVMKFDEFTEKYNDRLNELNDAKLIIRELKVELRERNQSENVSANSNTFLFIIENEVIVSTATFKKLLDSFVFTDDKDSIIDD